MKADLKNGTRVVNGNTLVKQWAIEWLDTYKKDSVRQRTYSRYKGDINNILIPAVGNMRIKDVRQVHLQRMLNSLKGKSEDHIKKVQQMTYNIFEKAKKSNMVNINPADDLDLPMAMPDASHRALTDEERHIYLLFVKRIERACGFSRCYTVVYVPARLSRSLGTILILIGLF